MAVQFAQTCASRQSLKQVFRSVDALSCPWSFNFHMHTVYSDGRLLPSELMQQAIDLGLKGIAITDHHTLCGYQVAQNWLENWKLSEPGRENLAPCLWSGIEINATLLNTEVHILGYAFDPQHPSLSPYTQKQAASGETCQAHNVITAIHQAGGLAVLAHPARYKRSHFDLVPAAVELQIDGVETYYAYNNPTPWKPSPKETQQVQLLSTRYDLLNSCGTDTHGLSLLKRL